MILKNGNIRHFLNEFEKQPESKNIHLGCTITIADEVEPIEMKFKDIYYIKKEVEEVELIFIHEFEIYGKKLEYTINYTMEKYDDYTNLFIKREVGSMIIK